MDNENPHPAGEMQQYRSIPRSRWSVRPGLAALFGFFITFAFLYGTLVVEAQQREQAREHDTRVLLEVLAARTQERINSYLGALKLLSAELSLTNAGVAPSASVEYFQQRARALVKQFDAYQAVTVLSPEGVIVRVAPLAGNESALGLDVTSVPVAAVALQEARFSGQLAMTPPLELAQGGLGFVGYLPLGSPPGNGGFFSAVFRVKDFIEPLLSDRLLDGYALRVSDLDTELFEYGKPVADMPRVETQISVGQRHWKLELSPVPNSTASRLALSADTALLIAVTAAFVMGIVFHQLARGATAELASRAEAWRIAHTNSLTGMPNRYSLLKALESINATNRRSYGLLLIDLLQFRLINAVHGQAIADKVIQWVGTRLRNACNGHEVFHLGGAEFAVLATDVTPRETRGLAERLQELVNRHVAMDDVELDIDGEVGYVQIDERTSASEPLNRAGAALVRAKERGGPAPYDESIREDAQARVFLETELRSALARDQLELYYQPICRLDQDDTTHTMGFEALLRWHHPDLGMVAPDVFIPIAESSGLIDEIGRWVLHEACMQIARWRSEGRDYRVGINVSSRQMLDRGLSADVEQVLEETGAPADSLVIEITESLAIRNLESAVQMLTELQEVGVRIALDDFGTGYSSLSYLNLLPIDILKLDRVLISHIDHERQSLEIARGMIALAHAIGLQVVAEGVETEDQLALLRSLQCDMAQGYLFDRPRPAIELAS